MIPLLLLSIYVYSSQGSNSRYTLSRYSYFHFLLIILIASIAYFTLIASVSLIAHSYFHLLILIAYYMILITLIPSVTRRASITLIVSIILITSIILLISSLLSL